MKFLGYRRPDGRAGVRNLVVVMPGVLCSSAAAQQIASAVPGTTFLYNHNGCGQSPSDTEHTLEVLSGLIANGNVYGALIVGLGCEATQKELYLEAVSAKTCKPLHYISIHEEGGVGGTVAAGVKIARRLVEEARQLRREEIDISELILGLECGGSDPTSGISANVVLGDLSDRLVDMGATVVISETSEAIGAEDILLSRGRTPEIGRRLREMVRKWDRDIKEQTGADIRLTNPTPGNIAAGLTTLAEKSLGCIHKSGTRPFEGVLAAGEYIRGRGLYYMDTTAYDCGSITAKIAGGAQVVAFTTGMGNPIGSPIAPVIKITGNRATFEKHNDMLDFDTSASLRGEKDAGELGKELLDFTVAVCGGRETKAEVNGSGVVFVNQRHSCG